HSVATQPSTHGRFSATGKARCTFALEDGFNMSYLQHFAHYTGGTGGIDGPLNQAEVDDLYIAPLADGTRTPRAGNPNCRSGRSGTCVSASWASSSASHCRTPTSAGSSRRSAPR